MELRLLLCWAASNWAYSGAVALLKVGSAGTVPLGNICRSGCALGVDPVCACRGSRFGDGDRDLRLGGLRCRYLAWFVRISRIILNVSSPIFLHMRLTISFCWGDSSSVGWWLWLWSVRRLVFISAFQAPRSILVAILVSLSEWSFSKPGRIARIRSSSGFSSVVMNGVHSSHVPHGSRAMLKLGNGTNFRFVLVSPLHKVKLKLSSVLVWLSVVLSRTRYFSHVGADAPGVHVGRRIKSNETIFPLMVVKSLLRW